MKALWILFLILVLILAIDGLSTYTISSTSQQMQGQIDQIEDSIHNEDWEQTIALVQQTDQMWTGMRPKWESLLDHKEVENIDIALWRIQSLIAYQKGDDILPELAELGFYLSHLRQKQMLNWSNII